ncbi:hypothetical protein CCR94_17720 [Rhodoblastus sphagnicola]|uniref:Uncharacterized protein n=1 Tax=Rhodoblastus sphagnicola TaxID=333368 RepID=A0A2S6N1P1_9HYPH|nr:hypothetical protein [Rhodoblastus sphagnicola]MBB4199161.1 putative membrane protein [Rhodoblastus sphagnicola]PPQ28532.1 hypothetical protein CCR94_17720 [Rhodoblastus sphagnicola]
MIFNAAFRKQIDGFSLWRFAALLVALEAVIVLFRHEGFAPLRHDLLIVPSLIAGHLIVWIISSVVDSLSSESLGEASNDRA